MSKTDWKELSNYEMEIKLKELEFKYEKAKLEVSAKYKELEGYNSDFLNGKLALEKRLYPSKFK